MVRLIGLFSEKQIQPTGTKIVVFGQVNAGTGSTIATMGAGYVSIATGLHSVKRAEINVVRGNGGPFPGTALWTGYATAGSELEIDFNAAATMQTGNVTLLYFAVGDA